MTSVLVRVAPYLYGVLRIAAGLMFAVHGAQKLFGLFGGRVVPLMSQAGLAGVIEIGGGLLIALGLFTSVAALVASAEMAVAYFQAHAPRGLVPNQNGGELAVLYCLLFLYIAARGTVALGVRR